MVAIGCDSEKVDSSIGFSFGELRVILMPNDDQIAITSFYNGQETLLFQGPNAQIFTFRLNILANSTVDITCNDTTINLTDCTIFDGYQLENFKVILISGMSCVLRGYSIYEDRLTKDVTFFNAENLAFNSYLVSDRVAMINCSEIGNPSQSIFQLLGATNSEDLADISAFELADRLKVSEDVELDSDLGDPYRGYYNSRHCRASRPRVHSGELHSGRPGYGTDTGGRTESGGVQDYAYK